MKLSDFDFDLPEGLIATRPSRPRSASRLLVATGAQPGAPIRDWHVSDLPGLLRPGDLLVLNDTRVIPARLVGERLRSSDMGETRARVEITLLSPNGDGSWQSLAKPGKRLKTGETVDFGEGLCAEVMDKAEGEVRLAFNQTGAALDAALDKLGQMPLPPYIAALRPVDAQDRTDYQTVFARERGAVAAPTASLHFDAALLRALADKGVQTCFVTLHVGAGTFLPVKVEDVTQHRMHAEWGRVSAGAARAINQTRQAGGRVLPVGTTALRLIESAALNSGRVAPFAGETDIFIRPGHRFLAADGLMTNFHLPKSTLMMLVSALMGRERVMEIYAHAIAQDYRFFSYGDSSLLLP